MTFKEVLDYGADKLEKAGIEESRNDSFLLLEYVFNISRTMYLVRMKETACEDKITEYKAVIERRCLREPLQHITGHQEFMGFDFKVNKDVLIPRQDTEVVVEAAIKLLKDIKSPKILDICTGSGCIAISLDKLIDGADVTAADISEAALSVARENNYNLGGNVTFVKSDLYSEIKECMCYDLIISNPPYICSKEIEKLMPEVKNFEPKLALDGFEDGLFFYRKIIENADKYLKKQGVIVFEIGYDQGMSIRQILEDNGFSDVVIGKDLAGLDRVVTAEL